MYSVGNVMNVKGEPVQCSVFDKDGKYVRRFYFDAETREIWCNNYPTLVNEFGQEDTVRAPIKARTKKEAEVFFCSEEGIKLMAHIIRIMVGELVGLRATKQAERQEAREAKKVEAVEPKPVYAHEIFTADTETYNTLANHPELAGLKCWHLNDDSEYYRITLESSKDATKMLNWLIQEAFSFDDVITDVLEIE